MPKILEILQSEYYTEYEMIEKEYLIPKIYHGGKNFDISKRWYVYYSYLNMGYLSKYIFCDFL
jgi:hypothetical protein